MIRKRNAGMTLVELMVALALSSIVMGALVQVIVSNEMTSKLNDAMGTVNESGRSLVFGLSNALRHAGRTDLINSNINTNVDVVEENGFIRRTAVAVPGDFPSRSSLGSSEGSNGGNDELVIGLRDSQDCTGNQHGFAGQEFYVVNHFKVNGAGALVCTGMNGRALRGQSTGTEATVTVVNNVESFQILYGIAPQGKWGPGAVERYVNASGLIAARNQNEVVASIKIAVLLSNGESVNVTASKQFQLLDEAPITPAKGPYRKQFSFEVYLRNLANQSGVL